MSNTIIKCNIKMMVMQDNVVNMQASNIFSVIIDLRGDKK